MRGKISDQDLADYALNELQPEERLYIESILAVSEECRHDIYQMIELSQMLEEGFENEDARAQALLTGTQRDNVLHVRKNYNFLAKIAAALVAAASVAFTISHNEFQQMRAPARRVADVSKHAAQVVADAVVSPENVEFENPVESLRALAEESSKFLQTEVMPPPMVCTPPTLLDAPFVQLTGHGDVTQ